MVKSTSVLPATATSAAPRRTVTPGLAGSSSAGSDTATPVIKPWVSCSAAAMAAPPPLEMLDAMTMVLDGVSVLRRWPAALVLP
ncbi:hypothetical protein D3C72_1833160 [compost metagenome]